MKTNKTKIFIVLGIFAAAMGLLETSVVVYLRELYYPEGFSFPIKKIHFHISKVEIWREIATILMLWGIGYLTGKNKLERFAYFCYAFAIWDIFYYIFLYVFLAWPESIFTWDLLFLLPFPWVGPVWAPVLISLLMIICSIIFVRKKEINPSFEIAKKWWILLFAGGTICIISFMWDFFQLSNFNFNVLELISNPEKSDFIYKYIPKRFNFLLFYTGFFVMLIAVFAQFNNPLKLRKNENKV